MIAFADHPIQGDDSGSLSVVDLEGHKKSLTEEWFTIQGAAWSPDGKEVWFTASKSGTDRTLYAVTLDGKQRIVAPAGGSHAARHRERWPRAAGPRNLAARADGVLSRRQQGTRTFMARLHLSCRPF